MNDHYHGIDVEAELARILQEEIWKEITAETGKTKQDFDNEIIAELKSFMNAEFYNNVYEEND